MREHMGLFRGRRKADGEWVQGCYARTNRKAYKDNHGNLGSLDGFDLRHVIIQDNGTIYEVDPDTVCECTGLTDKDGDLIFEGDIVEGGHFTYEDGLGEIMYDTESARFQIIGREPNNIYADFDDYYGREVEVMGNLWDNPELIGGNGDG